MSADARERLPAQIKFIAVNEAAERFSYYGMASILTLHMVNRLGLSEAAASRNYHLFGFALYLTPLVGAFIADRYWGRYRTILWLSFGYVAGHATIAAFESVAGLYAGLVLLAVGAGGIKPCASAFAGDQVPRADAKVVSRVYDLYYAAINIGSLASTLVIPVLNATVGPRVAFGVPGLAMAFALLVFWLGRRSYRQVAPTGPNPHGFFRVVGRALVGGAGRPGAPAGDWLERAGDVHPPEAIAGARAVFRISAVFAPVAVFWSLFFQYGSTWTVQAEAMDRRILGRTIPPEWPQNLDAGFVLLLIWLFVSYLFPALERRGVRVTALRKMTVGMFVTVLSFVAAAAVQGALEAGLRVPVAWQIPQYLFLSIGEVLVSVTALEFAFTQAPRQMRSAIMALWYLTISLGQLLTALVAAANRFRGVPFFLFFAALMLAAALVFAWIAFRYRPVAFTDAERDAAA